MPLPLPNLTLSAPSSSASSAQVDGRQGFDGSGWVVSTGGGHAAGGTSGGMRLMGGFGQAPQRMGTQVPMDYTGQAFGQVQQQQAGGSSGGLLAMLAAAAFFILR